MSDVLASRERKFVLFARSALFRLSQHGGPALASVICDPVVHVCKFGLPCVMMCLYDADRQQYPVIACVVYTAVTIIYRIQLYFSLFVVFPNNILLIDYVDREKFAAPYVYML